MKSTLKNKVIDLITNPLIVFVGILLISAFSLMSALVAQYVFGLEPCILCLYQRVPFFIAMILALIGLAFQYKMHWSFHSARIVFICSLVFLANAVIAFYHSGVEQHWWTSFLEGCAVDFDTGGDVNELMKLFEAKPAVRCDEIPWQDPVFGLSMAVYNFLLCTGLFIGCIFSALFMARRRNGLI
jgi:disulfide bond formation protein DsbB